ncbi:ribosomal protein S18 acetylase RimI-like enzyme [Isoptericola jiangsuensis]|uniref:Ribosomal protein S18 acetylase RimI-like enzyme n=1 Tax=Isoptericola jiangsuensis TaxID=548579 RepID=A0A2A9EV75_9MICO|nr:GNAT family N-acetyltransferase [Isoptericola jiangsuensis]PFG42466.1 ribosomal protein S18 acetylase RimI-like enzyme [Isoptericola jiangsuensis]
MIPTNERPSVTLPEHWTAVVPELEDVPRLGELRGRQAQPFTGSAGYDAATVEAEVAGQMSWTRRQTVVRDADGVIRAWAHAHDRAAGRAVIGVEIDRTLPRDVQDRLAAWCYDWLTEAAVEFARLREQDVTQLDAGAFAGDDTLRGWLTAAGFERARTWWQMSRPVTADDAAPDALPAPKPGVTVRQVAHHDNGLPVAEDLTAVHRVLEEAFRDHFNSYLESFPEFVQRLREDPGHRWNHWWLAFVDDPADPEAEPVPAGALVATVSPADDGGVEGTYVDYLGSTPAARGRGVATAMLHAVVADAAGRGRNRVGLEVDADSPTGAEALYVHLGWRTKYTTESWHRDVRVD